jgi:hypothetical protein
MSLDFELARAACQEATRQNRIKLQRQGRLDEEASSRLREARGLVTCTMLECFDCNVRDSM